jgi:conjugative transfer pilus assembly protein TraH
MAGFLVLAILVWSSPSRAAWIDDWIAQKTTTSADFFEGQKRHYGTFGSFSARWEPSQDHVFSVTPPRFKSGCGGIDVFLGGFSFLNADYLVQKLQNLINAAPAVAFDLALNTLCSQCSKTIKAMEAMSSRLNQLQFDDCKASKAIVATIAEGLTSGDAHERAASAKSHAIADYVQSTGIEDLWKSITNKGKNKSAPKAMGDITGASQSAMVSSCPANIRNVFFKTGFLLDHLGAQASFPASYAQLMRGYIGDVSIDGSDLQYNYVAPCPKNSPENIRGLVDGEVWLRPTPGSTCVKQTSVTINGNTYPNVRTWVLDTLTSVCRALITRSGLTTDEEDFIRVIPMPVYNAMLADMTAAGPTANAARIADIYADTVASSYAYAMITDLYDMIRNVLEMSKQLASAGQGATNLNDQDHCHIELAQGAVEELNKMSEKLPSFMIAAREQYTATLSELVAAKEYEAKVRDATEIVRTSLAKNFSEPLARRVTR